MNRRTFLLGMTGCPLASAAPVTVLQAAFSAHLPERRLVRGRWPAPYYERRVYRGTPGVLRELRALLELRTPAVRVETGKRDSRMAVWTGFNSLEERGWMWTNFAADPGWIALRQRVVVSEIAIYQPGGRIFEMSL